MRRTRLSLAVTMVAAAAVLGLPATAYADPDTSTPAASASAPGTPTAGTPTAGPTEAASAPAGPAEAAGPSGDVAATSSGEQPSAAVPEPTAEAPAAEQVPAAAADQAAAAVVPGAIPVQLLAMNDFHGRIANTTGGDSQLLTGPGPDAAYGTADDVVVTVGGSANVATTVKQQQAAFGGANSFFVGAGDLVSASPFESSVFKDEPTIEVLNAMGLDYSSVGNHEFDRGLEELYRISGATDDYEADHDHEVTACEGVTIGVDGCFTDSTGAQFAGADYEYLAANVVDTATGTPVLPPFQLLDIGGGQQMALIGVVTKTTPTLVSPDGIAGLTFLDEAEAVNTWTSFLRAAGVESIGVLVHEGGAEGAQAPPVADYDSCNAVAGPIVDINDRIDPAVDFIVSAHTHQAYNCLLPVPGGEPRLVTQAGFYGRLITDIRLSVDPLSGDVIRTAGSYAATNIPVTRTAPDPAVQAIVDYWLAQSDVAGNVSVGTITGDVLRAGAPPAAATRDAESSLGNFVATSQLAGLQEDQFGNPVVAFMNPGGLRTDLTYASSGPGDPDGNVTYREVFNVQPFGNTVNAITLTGADIRQVLEQQFPTATRTTTLVLGTSEGFAYSYDPARPTGDKIDPCSITIGGVPVDPAGSYRVVANSFLVAGGDGFTAFTGGSDPVTGPVDVDTAVSYLRENSPVAPPAVGHGTISTTRATCTPAGGGTGGGGDGGGGTGGGASPTPAPSAPTAQPVAGEPRAGSATPARTASGRGSLAYTGADVAPVLALGGLLLVTGGAATAAGYRRRRGLAD